MRKLAWIAIALLVASALVFVILMHSAQREEAYYSDSAQIYIAEAAAKHNLPEDFFTKDKPSAPTMPYRHRLMPDGSLSEHSIAIITSGMSLHQRRIWLDDYSKRRTEMLAAIDAQRVLDEGVYAKDYKEYQKKIELYDRVRLASNIISYRSYLAGKKANTFGALSVIAIAVATLLSLLLFAMPAYRIAVGCCKRAYRVIVRPRLVGSARVAKVITDELSSIKAEAKQLRKD
jgi:hypothetical protein